MGGNVAALILSIIALVLSVFVFLILMGFQGRLMEHEKLLTKIVNRFSQLKGVQNFLLEILKTEFGIHIDVIQRIIEEDEDSIGKLKKEPLSSEDMKKVIQLYTKKEPEGEKDA